MSLLSIFLTITIIKNAITTIDLNAAELQYIADHLTPEECRELIAAAHFESYEKPNALDQAERKVSKDLTCIQLLHHWNSEPNEGRGETHEALEHRLRQMGKLELADWLGRTVFHELAVDLNRSLEEGLKELVSEKSTSDSGFGPTLIPVVKNSEPAEYSFVDNLLYAVILGLTITGLAVFLNFILLKLKGCLKNNQKKKIMRGYSEIEDISGSSESEDRFDVREHTRVDESDKEG